MVRAIAPFYQNCPACHWRGPVIRNQSDCIDISDLGSAMRATCPKCGSKDLTMERASKISATLALLSTVFEPKTRR